MNIAIVTGVLGGIGKESALHLCRRGYAVVGMDVVDAIANVKTNASDKPLEDVVILGIDVKDYE